jgi:hypothetical protein
VRKAQQVLAHKAQQELAHKVQQVHKELVAAKAPPDKMALRSILLDQSAQWVPLHNPH